MAAPAPQFERVVALIPLCAGQDASTPLCAEQDTFAPIARWVPLFAILGAYASGWYLVYCVASCVGAIRIDNMSVSATAGIPQHTLPSQAWLGQLRRSAQIIRVSTTP